MCVSATWSARHTSTEEQLSSSDELGNGLSSFSDEWREVTSYSFAWVCSHRRSLSLLSWTVSVEGAAKVSYVLSYQCAPSPKY
jgi:hypothetical protein